MYKLIAIDLDGTLLTDDKRISEENLETLKKAIDRGYEIVIATGRRYWSAKEKVKNIDSELVIMANNGNIVRRMKDDEILIQKYLNIDDFHILVEEGKKKGLYPIVHVDGYDDGYDMIIELDKDNFKYHNYLADNIDRFKKVKNVFKVSNPKVLAVVYMGIKKELEEFYLYLIDKYPEKYNSHIMYNLTGSHINDRVGLLEVMNPCGTKWLSLEEYGMKKGILPEEIIAIGDDNNDIAMIKNAGLGIAMKNATEMTKKVSDIITKKNNNENGVAHTLKWVLKL
ncbi:Cof-type HAD-IIB family hydrolase [Anaerosalibacter massiliensis]|uniref:Cof-type HAD-IIB family hydrolase n=1 Tax=Anaerosalibacter massiliensis TaxID=1347392 RepID=A0A9X2MK82_9FIRM|nr:Cof-type HAD-IIB family hydrolase [Anaerosalibacter massiliensis]MCR2045053.1 Cof-type HAD-IIB family hydrolase [Anaerosalibacter massiliensis]